jgi:hypothetical protein
MPAGVMYKATPVTSGVTTANVFTGSQFALITEPSIVSVGVNCTDSLATFGLNIGNRIIVETGTPVPINTVANAPPIIPDQMYYTFPALPGEILQLTVTGGSTATVRSVAQIAAA